MKSILTITSFLFLFFGTTQIILGQITFDALPDCDDTSGSTGTAAGNDSMYIHISNLTNASGTTTFSVTSSTSGIATVDVGMNSIASGSSGTILITGLTDSDYGTIITIRGSDDGTGTTADIELPVVICGFSVDNGGDGNTEDDITNGVFCTTQNGITAPGILVESVPTSSLSSGNDITNTDVYVLVDTDNSNQIITVNRTGLFSSPNVVDETNYSVYAFKVDDTDLANFEGAITPGTTSLTDITGMTDSFASFCYSNCWNAAFAPDCFTCPTISALSATSPICSGTAITDLQATIANFFNTENSEDDYDVEFLYTTTQAASATAVYALTAEVIDTFEVTTAGITSATASSFTLPTVTTQTTYYIYARILDASSSVPDANCRPFAEVQVVVNPDPVVEAGDAQTLCSTGILMISSLSASITGVSTGIWTTSGSGIFDDTGTSTGDFPTSTTYTPSSNDITAGSVTLTLTSTGAISPCANNNDTVIITFRNVSCDTSFPWSGNNDD